MILPYPLINEPLPLPKRWGEPERERLESMLSQPSLFYWKGAQTTALLTEFRRHYPLPHAFPTSSGSASIHVAVASLRLQPGDEIIVPAITDMGSVIGILYQQGVPVFADVDPHTYTLDVADVRRRITSRTRAIMPVHLAGNPSDMQGITQLAQQHNLSVIEDCAQAWGARFQGRPVGLDGDLACFSFNDYKHLSCGDGGIVATKQAAIGTELGKWGDKFYDRVRGGRDPDELAPNYRMSEPQAAVAAAQLTKLPGIAAARTRVGNRLTTLLHDVRGIQLPKVNAGDIHSYWFYLLRLEVERFACSRDDYANTLASEGVSCTAGYIPRAVYRYPVFQTHGFFGGHWPIRDFGLTQMDYRSISCPVADSILDDCVKLTINEAMSDDYVEKIARAVKTVTARLLY